MLSSDANVIYHPASAQAAAPFLRVWRLACHDMDMKHSEKRLQDNTAQHSSMSINYCMGISRR